MLCWEVIGLPPAMIVVDSLHTQLALSPDTVSENAVQLSDIFAPGLLLKKF